MVSAAAVAHPQSAMLRLSWWWRRQMTQGGKTFLPEINRSANYCKLTTKRYNIADVMPMALVVAQISQKLCNRTRTGPADEAPAF
jgi:hypothetical protein